MMALTATASSVTRKENVKILGMKKSHIIVRCPNKQNHLSRHRQCVRVGSCVSDLLPVTSGVPQGSILGPLLFILYVNDLPAVPIHSSLLLFADDSKFRKKIQSIEDSQLLQSDLCRLCQWSHSSGLIFNSSKSCVLSPGLILSLLITLST